MNSSVFHSCLPASLSCRIQTCRYLQVTYFPTLLLDQHSSIIHLWVHQLCEKRQGAIPKLVKNSFSFLAFPFFFLFFLLQSESLNCSARPNESQVEALKENTDTHTHTHTHTLPGRIHPNTHELTLGEYQIAVIAALPPLSHSRQTRAMITATVSISYHTPTHEAYTHRDIHRHVYVPM